MGLAGYCRSLVGGAWNAEKRRMNRKMVGLLGCLLNMGLVVAGPLPAGELPPTFTNSIGMEFALIPAGRFVMGCAAGEKDCRTEETPPHEVVITRPFYLGKHEVTQAQWEAVVGRHYSRKGRDNPLPEAIRGPDMPVVHVSWYEAETFLSLLNEKEGRYRDARYRLPSEAQWEYAARAGSTTRFFWGDDAADAGNYAWTAENAGGLPHPVGQKRPNAWGLYDMCGNVAEWVRDWFSEDYYAASPLEDPLAKGAKGLRFRGKRGSDWKRDAGGCASARRSADIPVVGDFDTGFRVMIMPEDGLLPDGDGPLAHVGDEPPTDADRRRFHRCAGPCFHERDWCLIRCLYEGEGSPAPFEMYEDRCAYECAPLLGACLSYRCVPWARKYWENTPVSPPERRADFGGQSAQGGEQSTPNNP